MEFFYDPEHLGEDVKALFAGATSALIVAPFVTRGGLLPLIGALAPDGRLDVVTRWEPREIQAGVSDPMIIDDIEATGGTVRLLPRLHAKVYVATGQALVGSANPTGPGLGFTTPANVEIVVAAAAADRAVTRLLATIDAVASTADRDYAIQLVDYATALPATATVFPPDQAARATHWIPHTTVPSRVTECYFGSLDRADYRADLGAIDAPPGLSADGFRTHVGLVLQQGLIGKIYQECEGLQQWRGIEHMRQLLSDARVETDQDPPLVWRRILNWFQYYLQTNDSLNGGYSAKR